MHRSQIIAAALASWWVAGFATPAGAETVKATLTFTDGDGTARPIVDATVEVWRFRPGMGWTVDMTVKTNESGQLGPLGVGLPFAGSGVMVKLIVYATNSATRLYDDPIPFHLSPVYREVGFPFGTITRVTTSPSDVLDFSFQFVDPGSNGVLNVADALLKGYKYAAANRDPRETDTLGQVALSMQGVTATSLYDPITKSIRLKPEDAMNDYLLLHEYAHYLEEHISGFVGSRARASRSTRTAIPTW
jgi:hypothetical protein